MSAPTPSQNALQAKRRRRFRVLGLGALAFILLQITLLVTLPSPGERGGLLGLIIADALLAAIVGVVLVLSLRKN